MLYKYLPNSLILALHMMHTSGWVHRDVSTGNILIDATGRARLADVEHARHMDDTSSTHPVRTVRQYSSTFPIS